VYGSRRIADALVIKVRYPKHYKVTTDSNHNDAISPNKLDRQLTVKAPNKVWTSDVTYVWTLEGWIFGVETPNLDCNIIRIVVANMRV